MNIIFSNISKDDGLEPPAPASKNIPQWYKDTHSYIEDVKKPRGNGATASTIKKCVPIFDSITSGYIIKSTGDLYVSQKDGLPWYEWPGTPQIEFHEVWQAETHPSRKGIPIYPKWLNYWSIETPKNYSCLFTTPMHHDLPFTILPGIVDTDRYHSVINFPFVLNDPEWQGLIPKGTPIAQIIPFKREKWNMKIGDFEQSKKHIYSLDKVKNVFFDGYRNNFWDKKQYK